MSFVTGGTGYAIFGDTPWPSEIFSRSDFIVSSRPHCDTAKIILEYSAGAPNDGFLLNTLKLLFRLSRVLSDVETDAF